MEVAREGLLVDDEEDKANIFEALDVMKNMMDEGPLLRGVHGGSHVGKLGNIESTCEVMDQICWTIGCG